MKSSIESIVSRNRNLVLILLMMFGLGLFGLSALPSNGETSAPALIYGHDRFAHRLFTFNGNSPGTFISNIAITGLNPNEQLVGIDIRPADGLLYGVGTTGTASRLVRINTMTGAVTTVGTGFAPPLAFQTFYGVDFDPTTDRLRVIGFNDINIRINPVNGTLAGTDPNIAFAPGDRNFGDNPAVDMIAYSDPAARNENLGEPAVLYGIDTANGVLVIISSNGQLTTVGPLGQFLSTSAGLDFDFATGDLIATYNDGVYRINIFTGEAVFQGSLPTGGIDGMTIPRPVATPTPTPRPTATATPTPTPTPTPVPCSPTAPQSPGIVTGTDTGSNHVKRFNNALAETASFLPFGPTFNGGVRVAVGDINGDGIDDIAAGAGPGGGPQVMVFSGGCTPAIRSFLAYSPSFTGGVFVAVGDINGDGVADIITGSDAGMTAQVKVFDAVTLGEIRSFQPFAGFGGGIRVASGDVNGDGRDDIIVGAGAGGGPHVKVFDGVTNAVHHDFFAYETNFLGGVFVGAADMNDDGRADIVTGAGPGGGPHVKVFSGNDLLLIRSFFAFEPTFMGGVRVAVGRVNDDVAPDILVGAAALGLTAGFALDEQTSPDVGGGTSGGPRVKVFDGVTNAVIRDFLAYPPPFAGGVFVAAPPIPMRRFVSVSGRVLTPGGVGLRNAVVVMTDSQGNRRLATTSSFGVYSFENVRTGETYFMNAFSKRFRFAPRTLMVNDIVMNEIFTGLE